MFCQCLTTIKIDNISHNKCCPKLKPKKPANKPIDKQATIPAIEEILKIK